MPEVPNTREAKYSIECWVPFILGPQIRRYWDPHRSRKVGKSAPPTPFRRKPGHFFGRRLRAQSFYNPHRP
ncbi:hypothetical protein C8R44DRAFT_792535 [Mycena epipterygia]|nr:hypothetical protein C8R44DRAFT_792535 [Mycena epipterygia]